MDTDVEVSSAVVNGIVVDPFPSIGSYVLVGMCCAYYLSYYRPFAC